MKKGSLVSDDGTNYHKKDIELKYGKHSIEEHDAQDKSSQQRSFALRSNTDLDLTRRATYQDQNQSILGQQNLKPEGTLLLDNARLHDNKHDQYEKLTDDSFSQDKSIILEKLSDTLKNSEELQKQLKSKLAEDNPLQVVADLQVEQKLLPNIRKHNKIASKKHVKPVNTPANNRGFSSLMPDKDEERLAKKRVSMAHR